MEINTTEGVFIDTKVTGSGKSYNGGPQKYEANIIVPRPKKLLALIDSMCEDPDYRPIKRVHTKVKASTDYFMITARVNRYYKSGGERSIPIFDEDGGRYQGSDFGDDYIPQGSLGYLTGDLKLVKFKDKEMVCLYLKSITVFELGTLKESLNSQGLSGIEGSASIPT